MTGFSLALPLLMLSLAPAPPADHTTPTCPAPGAARLLLDARLPAADDPRLNGSWLDCYVACIESQWPGCVNQCGSHDPMTNPCLAVCYDSIALGCAIGCTHWGGVPNALDAGTP